jgi:cell fate (sporulation/competence/biofilm development) regulator YmcA (YheA/YmcA/DUF963 family)
MGSKSSSIHPETIEVSFIDKTTGKLMSNEEIKKISEKACKEFDYHPSFYDAYKKLNAYNEYAKNLKT